jgi:hypothetical protein
MLQRVAVCAESGAREMGMLVREVMTGSGGGGWCRF